MRKSLGAAVAVLTLASCAGTQATGTPQAGTTTQTSGTATGSGSATATATPVAKSSTASPSASASATTKQVDCTKQKCVALTYDDGPSPLTPKLLKAFTDRHATATLFMLGNAAETYPETVRQAYAQGFEIANHTYDHQAISGLSDSKVAWEVSKTNTILTKLTGEKPTLMRPPYAARTSRTDHVVGKEGLSVIVWNNSPEDWVAGHDTAKVIAKLTLERTSRNSIILMHDIHTWTVDAAPAIIDGLQKQGYTLVTVSQLLGTTKAGEVYPS